MACRVSFWSFTMPNVGGFVFPIFITVTFNYVLIIEFKAVTTFQNTKELIKAQGGF